MNKVLDLGAHYVSDFLTETQTHEPRDRYSLDVYLDPELGAGRLKDIAPAHTMWGKYWYRSGTNASMTIQLQDIVSEIQSRVPLVKQDVWLDIACNDGTLLKAVPDHLTKVGIDPADDTFYEHSSKVAHVVQDYFSAEAYAQTPFAHIKPKVVTCIAMFYDLSDPRPFIRDIHKIMHDDGMLVLQMSYTPLMLKQLAFDNICHEHVYYYSLQSIKKLFESENFVIRDCTLNDTNGGSFRVYLQKSNARVNSWGSAPLRDVCELRVDSLLTWETHHADISDPALWTSFGERIEQLKTQLVSFLKKAKQEGKSVYGYGASTKGNTLLQVFGIDHTLITAIAERSPAKFGLRTVGTNIPIISEDEMRAHKPDYLLILPWHFIHEFRHREKDLIASGTQFVVPCPQFEVWDT